MRRLNLDRMRRYRRPPLPASGRLAIPERPPAHDWIIMCCGNCGEPWDEWHRARAGRAIWSTSCRIDRAVSEWWARTLAGWRAQQGGAR